MAEVAGVADVAALVATEERYRLLAAAVEREHREHLAILHALQEGVVGVDLQGRCTFANRAAAALTGFRPEELQGQVLHPLLHHHHADGTPYPPEECPLRRALQGTPVHTAEEVLWRKDGTMFPVEYTALPVSDEAGCVTGTVVTFVDTTARGAAAAALRESEARRLRVQQRRAEQAERLAAVVAEVGAATDVDEALHALATGAVTLLGGDEGVAQLFAGAGRPGQPGRPARPGSPWQLLRVDAAGEVVARQSGEDAIAGSFAAAIRDGGPAVLVEDFAAYDSATHALHHRLVQERGMRAAVIVPIWAGGQPIGCLSVNHRQPRRFGPLALSLAETLAAQAGAVVERVRLQEALRANEARRASQAERLAAILGEVGAADDVEEALRALACGAVGLLGGDEGVVQLFGSGTAANLLLRVDATGTLVAREVVPELTPGSFAAAIRDGGPPALMHDFGASPIHPRLVQRGMRAAVAVPIGAGGNDGRAIGSLHVNHREVGHFGPEALSLAAALGTQAGAVIQRVRAQEALRASESRYHSVARSASDAIVIADERGVILSWDGGAATMFGFEEAEIVGQPLTRLMSAAYRAAHEAGLARVRATGKSRLVGTPLELRALRKDGSEFPAELSLGTWVAGGARFFCGILRDVSAREQAAAALRESEARFRRLAEHAPDIIYRYRLLPEPGYEYVSPAATAVTGYTPEEHYADPDLGQRLVHPDDLPLLAQRRATLRAAQDVGPALPLALRKRRKDGTTVWLEERTVAIWDDARQVVAIEGIARDVTAQKQAEAALVAANAELEEFARTISHDLKAPLTSIMGYADLLRDLYADGLDEDARGHLERIAANGARLAHMIDDVLALSRVGAASSRARSAEPVDLGTLVAQEVEALSGQIERTGATVSIASHLPVVRADPVLLKQIMRNLLANALTYGAAPDRPPLVEVGCASPAGPSDSGLADPMNGPGQTAGPAGGRWRLWVRDGGPGVPHEEQQRIFGLFERLPAGKAANPGGTGLGLAIVRKAAERLGGTAGVESPPGAGATFWIELPDALHMVAPAAGTGDAGDGLAPGAGGRP